MNVVYDLGRRLYPNTRARLHRNLIMRDTNRLLFMSRFRTFVPSPTVRRIPQLRAALRTRGLRSLKLDMGEIVVLFDNDAFIRMRLGVGDYHNVVTRVRLSTDSSMMRSLSMSLWARDERKAW